MYGEGKFCEQHSSVSKNDVVAFEMTSEHFRMEIQLFWTRANFYLAIEAALASIAFTQTANTFVVYLLSGVGVFLAIIWFLVSNGTAFWIRKWREQVMMIDREVNRFRSYNNIEMLVARNRLLSPTFITRFLPIFFIIFWISLSALAAMNIL
jgi:hypothetical protein